MIRRLTSAPKPSARVRVYIVEQVVGVARAGRSARRRSGRGWRRPRRGRSGSRRPARAGRAGACTRRLGAELAGAVQRRAGTASRTPGSMPSPESSSGTPRRTPRRSAAVGRPTGSGSASEVESHGSLADHGAEQQRGVGDVAGERAGLVERRGEGDHPVARDRAVGRLEADDPAQGRGLADRAAGVGADRPRRRAGRHGGGAAAGRAAGHARAVPGVADGP